MIDLKALLKNTSAYRIVKGDKKRNALSHAYLILTSDQRMLEEYVKIFISMMCCDQDEPCLNCRTCNLIKEKSHPDILFYPRQIDKEKKTNQISAEEISSLIEESFLRPIEMGKKIFAIINAENMNASAQNKLLKTLEEPPKNVHIILGATSEFPLLSTIKSRVKKLEIPAFSNDKLMGALSNELQDKEKLNLAISCSDGTIGSVLSLYDDEEIEKITDLAIDLLVNMKSSKDVLLYSTKISNAKIDINKFLSILDLILRDMLVKEQKQSSLILNKNNIEKLEKAERFNLGSIIHSLDCVVEANKRKKFNMTETMLIEWLLFQILEGKYKWQKF